MEKSTGTYEPPASISRTLNLVFSLRRPAIVLPAVPAGTEDVYEMIGYEGMIWMLTSNDDKVKVLARQLVRVCIQSRVHQRRRILKH